MARRSRRTVTASGVVMIWPGVSRKRRWMVSGVDGGVAGQPGAQRGGQGLGEDGEYHVEVDIEV